MPQLLAVQKPDGIYLVDAKPNEHNKKSILFTDDPNIKVGDKVNEDEYEKVWQYYFEGKWNYVPNQEPVFVNPNTRQILRRKAEGEKELEIKQELKQLFLNHFDCYADAEDLTYAMTLSKFVTVVTEWHNSLTPLSQRGK